jgi:hypothetical protein
MATLILGWGHRYKNTTVIIMNWLAATKYPFLKWQWIISLLRRYFSFLCRRQYFYWLDYELFILHDHLGFLEASVLPIICLAFCVVFLVWLSSFCVLYPMLPVSHVCPFLIAPLVFYKVFEYERLFHWIIKLYLQSVCLTFFIADFYLQNIIMSAILFAKYVSSGFPW